MNVRGSDDLRLEAERGRVLVEESREIVIVLDEEQRVIGASRRARESLQGLEEGRPLPPELVGLEHGATPLAVPYEVDGRRETLLYLGAPGDLPAYEELRAGFTAAVSHELRTPLARLLALLESASLPDADPLELIDQARGEVEEIDEFYRADQARASRGTGLGLAIVKHVVTSAGGSVEARRTRPHGLEVRCAFPVT